MKYIRFKNQPTIILFPDWMTHSDVAGSKEVSSAGFVDTERWVCFGESVSLGISANPDSDTPILKSMVDPKHMAATA